MTSTWMRPCQDPDDYMYHMDSFRDRFNVCDPPEGPTDRQYEGITLQALSSEYDRICQTHLERRDFGLAGIHRMMAAIDTDNLSRSKSSKGIAGRGAALQAVGRTTLVSYVITATNLDISKESAHSESNTISSSGSSQFGIISNNNMATITKSRANGGKKMVEAAEAVCDVHITRQRPITTLIAVSNSTKPAAMRLGHRPNSMRQKSLQCLQPARGGCRARTLLHILHANRGTKQDRARNGAQAEERHLAVWSTDSGPPLAVRGA